MSLLVEKISAGATLQDRGRHGFRQHGVPESGPMDLFSSSLANLAVGNDPTTSLLEIPPPWAHFKCKKQCFCSIVGGAYRVVINGAPLAPGSHALNLQAGDIVRVSEFRSGNWTYLALKGGIAGEPQLGSVSGNTIREGNLLCSPVTSGGAIEATQWGAITLATPLILPFVVTGKYDVEWIEATCFAVSLNSDRRGVRLCSDAPGHDLRQRSRPQLLGGVQWTPSGELIVIGPDGPTVGGYPLIGYLPRFAFNRLAQMQVGIANVILRPSTWDEVDRMANEEHQKLGLMASVIRPTRSS